VIRLEWERPAFKITGTQIKIICVAEDQWIEKNTLQLNDTEITSYDVTDLVNGDKMEFRVLFMREKVPGQASEACETPCGRKFGSVRLCLCVCALVGETISHYKLKPNTLESLGSFSSKIFCFGLRCTTICTVGHGFESQQ